MRRWTVVVLLYFGILISYIDRGNLGIAAAREIRKFHLTRVQREIEYIKVKLGGAAAWGLCDVKTNRSVFPRGLLRSSSNCPNNIHGSPGNGNRFFRGRHSGRKSHPPARGDRRKTI